MAFLNKLTENFEKPMTIRWCLTYLSALLFLDCYSLARFDKGLAEISFKFLEKNINFAESFILVLSFSLVFAFIIPGISELTRAIIDITHELTNNKLRSKEWREQLNKKVDKKHNIRLNTLKNIGIIRNNYSAYDYATKEIKDLENNDFLRMICQAIVIFTIFGWILSSQNSSSLPETFYDWLNSLDEIIKSIIILVWALIFLFILAVGFKEKPKHLEYAHIPGHSFDDYDPWKKK